MGLTVPATKYAHDVKRYFSSHMSNPSYRPMNLPSGQVKHGNSMPQRILKTAPALVEFGVRGFSLVKFFFQPRSTSKI